MLYTYLIIYNSAYIYYIINMIKTYMEDMKVTFTSKVQKHGGSKITSIPKTITDVLGIDKGTICVWELDTDNKQVVLRKLE